MTNDSTGRTVPAMLQNGQIIGRRFRILHQLGTGGMGHVYKALDENLGREVAVKLLSEQAVQDQTIIDRFFHEGRALAAIKHQAVIDIYSFETDEALGIPFFVMEYVDGRLLTELKPTLLRDRRTFAEYLLQLCEGIQACHERGVIHRDLKPNNVLVDHRGKVKLFDFGIAKTTLNQTQVGQTIGTAYYMSPEQCMGSRELTAKSDVYSLGIIIWEFLFGQVPYDAAPQAGAEVAIAVQHIQATLPQVAIDPHDPLLPLVPLVRRMLDKEPANRPDLHELIAALRSLLGQTTAGARLPSNSPSHAANESALSSAEKLSAIAFLLFVIVLTIFGLYDRYNPPPVSVITPPQALATGSTSMPLSATAPTSIAVEPPVATSAASSPVASDEIDIIIPASEPTSASPTAETEPAAKALAEAEELMLRFAPGLSTKPVLEQIDRVGRLSDRETADRLRSKFATLLVSTGDAFAESDPASQLRYLRVADDIASLPGLAKRISEIEKQLNEASSPSRQRQELETRIRESLGSTLPLANPQTVLDDITALASFTGDTLKADEQKIKLVGKLMNDAFERADSNPAAALSMLRFAVRLAPENDDLKQSIAALERKVGETTAPKRRDRRPSSP